MTLTEQELAWLLYQAMVARNTSQQQLQTIKKVLCIGLPYMGEPKVNLGKLEIKLIRRTQEKDKDA